MSYVNESQASKTIAMFRLGAAGLGNKAPRIGYPNRVKMCPLCPVPTPSTEQHVAMSCQAVETERKSVGLRTTMNLGLCNGLEEEQIYFNLMNGVKMGGERMTKEEFMELGHSLSVLLKKWLSCW